MFYFIIESLQLLLMKNLWKAMGKKVKLYNLIIAVLTAVIVVLAMNLVGSLLITAFTYFPDLSAMK